MGYTRSEKTFNLLFSLLTLLNGYSFFVANGFSIAMIVTSFFSVVSLIYYLSNKQNATGKTHFIDYSTVVLTIFFVLVSIVSIAVGSQYGVNYKGVVYGFFKLIVWAVFISLAGHYFFRYELFLKYSSRLVIVAFLYISIQYLLYYFAHVSVPSAINLGVIVPYSEEYGYAFEYGIGTFRPGGLWVEPSFMGYYFSCFLCLVLFDKRSNDILKKKTLLVIVTIIGLVLTMSTSAIGIALLVIVVYLGIHSKKMIPFFLAFIFILGAFFFIVLNYAPYHNWGVLGRSIYYSVYKLNNLSRNTRVGGSFGLLEGFDRSILGLGIGNISEYISSNDRYYSNSIVTVILWCGYVGAIALVAFFLHLFRIAKKDLYRIILVLIYIISGIYSGVYFSSSGIFYLIIIFYSGETKAPLVKEHYLLKETNNEHPLHFQN